MQESKESFEIRAAICAIPDTAEFLKKIQEISREFHVHIICFDADRIVGKRHVEAAVMRAVRSFATGKQISNTLEMESLLYAAGSRQCSIATSFGIHVGENHLYICCLPAREQVWEPLSSFLDIVEGELWETITPQKHALLMTLFGITPAECSTVTADEFPDLVLERVALLDVYR